MATDSFARHALLGEIEHQALLADRAAVRLPHTGQQFDSLDVWGAIHSILAAAANVSKILWPVPLSKAQGSAIRELLCVRDDNALKNRSLRNAFEHYDERLEDWHANRASAASTDQLIGSATGFPAGFSARVHRAFDTDTWTLRCLGESLDLRVVLAALRELYLKSRSVRHV